MEKRYVITEDQRKALLQLCGELPIKLGQNIYQFFMQMKPEEEKADEKGTKETKK